MTGWPLVLSGVTETVVTTRGPEGRWNLAALGVHAPADESGGDGTATARTWGKTRTRRNFERRGSGYVQFTTDPVTFVEAALDVVERDDPVLDVADAWAEVTVERVDSGREGGTEWVEWALYPVETAVVAERVGRFERGPAAVVEASVAASRLDVPEYDTDTLRNRIADCGEVVQRCGDERTREAFALLCELAGIEG